MKAPHVFALVAALFCGSAAAVTAPSAEPVMVRTRRAAAHVMTENDTIETSDAKAPVR